MIASQQESYDKPRQCVEKQRHYSANKGPYSQGTKELIPLNYGAGEDSWESLGQKGDQTSQS